MSRMRATYQTGCLPCQSPVGGIADGGRRVRDRGAAAVELAVALPLITLVLFAIVGVSTAVYNFEMLTSAVGAGARQLAASRGSATPFSSAQGAVDAYNAASRRFGKHAFVIDRNLRIVAAANNATDFKLRNAQVPPCASSGQSRVRCSCVSPPPTGRKAAGTSMNVSNSRDGSGRMAST